MESFYLSRKSVRARKRCQLEVPSKRRKLSNHGFAVAYYQEASSESVTNSPDKEIKRDISTSHAIPPRGQYFTIDLEIEGPGDLCSHTK